MAEPRPHATAAAHGARHDAAEREFVARVKAARVYDVARRTPLESAPRLSARYASNILLKREDLQPVFSFKLRGAYNKLAQMTADELRNGVVCASAGNHAQGVALAARELGTRATVVMPNTTPAIKIDAVTALGGEVVIAGEGYDDAYRHAIALAEREQRPFIHPFDDELVIAGQGTVGREILSQHADPIETIFVPVGGGGLAAGIAAYVKATRPGTRVIGVEPQDSPSMQAALTAGQPVTLERVGTFADGVAVRTVGTRTLALCRQYLDGMIHVTTDEICAAIKDIFNDTRTVTEAAGAIAVAGLKRALEAEPGAGRTYVAICSGANMNFDRLLHVTERANIGEHTEALLAVEIDERPGSFLTFCGLLGKRAVTEFNYRYSDPQRARIFVGIALRDGLDERDQVVATLETHGYPTLDLTDNELAKLHVRHMVGGYATHIDHERILRFEFPERPGALADFLRAIGSVWNISLFHYRNHGSDYGRVLCGVQVPPADLDEFERHLRDLGYAYQDESDNPACRMVFGGDA